MKYGANEMKDDIFKISQVNVMAQNESDSQFFVDNILPVEQEISSTISIFIGFPVTNQSDGQNVRRLFPDIAITWKKSLILFFSFRG